MKKIKFFLLLSNRNCPLPVSKSHKARVILSKEFNKQNEKEAKEISPTKLTYILLCKYSHFSFRSSLFSSCYNLIWEICSF